MAVQTMKAKAFGQGIFAALFILGGIGHFVATNLDMKMMPPYLPYHRVLVLLSGVFEVVLGLLLLVPASSGTAAGGSSLSWSPSSRRASL